MLPAALIHGLRETRVDLCVDKPPLLSAEDLDPLCGPVTLDPVMPRPSESGLPKNEQLDEPNWHSGCLDAKPRCGPAKSTSDKIYYTHDRAASAGAKSKHCLKLLLQAPPTAGSRPRQTFVSALKKF